MGKTPWHQQQNGEMHIPPNPRPAESEPPGGCLQVPHGCADFRQALLQPPGGSAHQTLGSRDSDLPAFTVHLTVCGIQWHLHR